MPPEAIPTPAASRRQCRDVSDAFGGAIADTFVAADGTIAVAFDPAKPGVIRIDSPWALYFLPALLCAPGVLFLSLIVYVWLRT